MRIEDFEPEHLVNLDLQLEQQYLKPYLSPELFAELQSGDAFTALEGDRVLACSGVIPLYDTHRGLAWAYLADDLGKDFIKVHLAVKRFLDIGKYKRVEATVDYGFEEGYRWLEALGFVCEAERMLAYHPNGRDAVLYARVTL